MKIAIFHELPVTSGSRKAVNNIAKELKKRNTVDLYLVDRQIEKSEIPFFSNIFHFPFTEISWHGNDWKSRLNRDTIELIKLFVLHKKIAQKIEDKKYDACFIHGSKFTQSPFILQHIKKTSTFYYAHASNYSLVSEFVSGLPKTDIFRGIYEKLNRFLRNTIDKKNVTSAKVILANSKYTQGRIKHIYKKESIVAYLGVDTHIYKPEKRKKIFDVLFIGSLQPVDDFSLLKKALQLIKRSVKLRTVFIENEWIKSDRTLKKIYNQSKIAVCTAFQEPFGLTAIEAESCGTPVIAVNEGGYKENILDSKTGFLVERDAKKLASKIKYLLANNKILKTFGKNARSFIEKSWSWEKNAQNIEIIMQNNILNAKRNFNGSANILFLFIFILGAFLRFYDINQNYSFYSEVGDNLLDIKNAFVHHYIPLLGPPTSHPWLHFGPLFYWIYGPILFLFHFDPQTHSYFGAFVSLLTILTNYVVIRKIFNTKVALFSSFFIAISPLYMIAVRVSRFIYIVPLLIYPFLWILYKILAEKKRYFFWLTFLLGIMLNFHYTPLVLIPFVAIIFVLKKVRLSKIDFFKLLVGFFLPATPLLLFDSMHSFMMSKNFLLWIPYKILTFLHLYKKISSVTQVPLETNYSFVRFFASSFIPHDYPPFTTIGILIFLAISLFIVWQIVMFVTKRERISLQWQIILLWGLTGLLAIFVHGSPPLHYFVPLFPLPIIVFSIFLNKVFTTKFNRIVVYCFLGCIIAINFSYYFSYRWFAGDSPISYKNKQVVTKFIVKDAHGEHFELHRVGYNNNFPKEFAEDYIYLLWLYGNEPVNKAHLQYTVYENPNGISVRKKEL